MFGRTTADVAREAREMASEVQHDHRSHVAVCLENQRRIEARFSDVVRKLESQDTALAMFKEEQNRRLGVDRVLQHAGGNDFEGDLINAVLWNWVQTSP
jgi:hypothetical protein